MASRFILVLAITVGVLLAGARDASLGPSFDTTVAHVEPGLENALFPSLTIDAAGNPVVSYAFSHSPTRLRVVHCNDPECLGGDESVAEPDATSDAGFFSSIELDAAGYPVVSYSSAVTSGLNIVHCNDPDCAGNDESVTTPDPAPYAASTSLALDSSAYPIVSYYAINSTDLKILHCNDADCSGGDESITSPDTTGDDVGYQSSIMIDSAGNPVVSYTDRTSPARINLLHCNDASCAGDDDPIETVDYPGSAGAGSSLALDSSGNPVVSYPLYQGGTSRMINVAHCNDADCAGSDESIETVVVLPSYTSLPGLTSLALDAAGYPVVAYPSSTSTTYDVNVAHCNDANCAGGDESVVGVDEGASPVVATTPSGAPVVAYQSAAGGMKVTSCAGLNCASYTAATSAGSNVMAALGAGVDVTFSSVSIAGMTTLSVANGILPGLNVGGPYYNISTTATHGGTATICIDYDGSSFTLLEEAALRMGHYERTNVWADITTSLDTSTNRICGQTLQLSPFTFLPLVAGQDLDGDACANDKELGANPISGGKRNPFNPWDYFNPSGDGLNRIDDILLVVHQYYKDDSDPSGGWPPYQPGYTTATDRRFFGPDPWDLGPPDAQERVDDILNSVKQYFHDCS